MKRIYLTKEEKKILRYLGNGGNLKLSKYEEYVARSLEKKEFVKGAYIEGLEVEAIRLLPYGKVYISKYPLLRNPLNLRKILRSILSTIKALFFML